MTVTLNADTIQGFVGSVLAKRFDGSVKSPECHREWWELCTGPDKFVAIAAPRGHAKSTAITLSYTLAAVLFRQRKYVVLVSDTEAQAAQFLGNIKQELQDNQDLIALFQLQKNEKGLVQFEKDSETDVIVKFTDGHRFRILAKGSEQKVRGLLWNGSRPDLIVCDDLENDEIVMNKERREKFRKWFYGALMPCRSKDGIVRYVGTILHMDAMLERLMPEYQLASLRKRHMLVREDLKEYANYRTIWKSVKYRAHNEDFSKILWPEKHPQEELERIRSEYVAQGMPEVYSQEYLNVPIDESVSYFRRSDFLPIRKEDREQPVHYYLTGDMAISDKERADYTVFCIAAVDNDKRLQIRNVVRERMDGREIVDTLIALQRIYNFEAVGLEEGQISKSIGPFLREAMVQTGVYLSLVPLKHLSIDKLTRARSIQARMRAGGVKFDKDADWYQAFEDECVRFPRDRHDDQVDAFAYMGLMLDNIIESPTKLEMQQAKYDEDLEEAGWTFSGRNKTTGY